ncbi:hypothetical protein [Holdemania massiliensis]|uniref:hypothetical protein n=1 Tax=Holdemania massiliensis TaxID=1468449 RepID=UPI001F062A9D|nr:hypothetical protein [Holdemania massiliensis]MCH1939260.1 hypothetical protein [Holdemania massiliensis]
MAEAMDTMGLIYQNLKDAGCNEETTEKCMLLAEKGEVKRMLPLLLHHRMTLLENIHFRQKQIDCLDYLVYKIQKETF